MAKMYLGFRHRNQPQVFVVGNSGVKELLNPRNDIWNHSPDGFEWGYGGSGPAQLALAILADAVGSDEVAIELHQDYKWEVISKMDRGDWVIFETNVRNWVTAKRSEQAQKNVSLN